MNRSRMKRWTEGVQRETRMRDEGKVEERCNKDRKRERE